jgi:hypothetical protein
MGAGEILSPVFAPALRAYFVAAPAIGLSPSDDLNEGGHLLVHGNELVSDSEDKERHQESQDGHDNGHDNQEEDKNT